MMRTLDAGRAQTLRRVEVPSALPYLLSGAKIAAVISVIGAVFGEWSGADEGLGHLILVAQGQLQTARVFAAVVVLSALAIDRSSAPWRWSSGGSPGGVRAATAERRVSAGADRAWRPRRRDRGRLRREDRGAPRRRLRAAHAGARLLRQPRPRRDLHRARPRLLRRGRARGRAPGALRPLGADPPGGGRARRPRDLLRARGAARPRAGPAGGRRRGAGLAPADLADLAARGRDRRRPATSRARRWPPPGSPTRPPTSRRSSSGEGRPRRRRAGGRRAQPAARRCSRAAPTRCSAAFSTSRASTSPSAGANPRVVPVDRLGIPTYDELVLVADSDRVAEDPEAIRLFIAALERGTRAAVARSGRGDRGDPRRRRRARARSSPGPRSTRTLPLLLPRARAQPVRLHGRARVGALRRLLRRPRPDLDPPAAAGDAHRRAAAGQDPGVSPRRANPALHPDVARAGRSRPRQLPGPGRPRARARSATRSRWSRSTTGGASRAKYARLDRGGDRARRGAGARTWSSRTCCFPAGAVGRDRLARRAAAAGRDGARPGRRQHRRGSAGSPAATRWVVGRAAGVIANSRWLARPPGRADPGGRGEAGDRRLRHRPRRLLAAARPPTPAGRSAGTARAPPSSASAR